MSLADAITSGELTFGQAMSRCETRNHDKVDSSQLQAHFRDDFRDASSLGGSQLQAHFRDEFRDASSWYGVSVADAITSGELTFGRAMAMGESRNRDMERCLVNDSHTCKYNLTVDEEGQLDSLVDKFLSPPEGTANGTRPREMSRPVATRGLTFAHAGSVTSPEGHRGVAVKPGWKPMSVTKIRAAIKDERLRKVNDSCEPEQNHQNDELRDEWRKGFDDPDSFDFETATWAQAEWQSARLADDTSDEGLFIPSKTYDMMRVGWVFRTGVNGVGYYKDGVPDECKLTDPLVGLSRAELELDKLIAPIGDPLAATAEDEEQNDAIPKKPKKRRDRKKRAREASEADITDFLKHETVKLSDQSHRGMGLWAIDTINPNAWPGAVEYMSTTAADAIMVQETRVAAEETAAKETSMNHGGWKVSVGKCLYGEGGGRSSGAAVGCRTHIGLGESCSDDDLPEVLVGRFRVNHMGAVCKGGLHIASAYPINGIGINHPKNLDIMQGIASVLRTLHGPWILGADFNCTPQQLRDTGWLDLVQGVIIESRVETCNGRVIDFFVVSNNFARNIAGIKVVEDALCNPHKPARLYTHAKSRAISVRTLRNPGTIGASMPYGPLNKDEPPPDDLDSWSNNQKYRYFLGRLEKIAAQLNGATDEDKARRVSRLQGPVFVQKDALQNGSNAGARKTTAVSRAWRKTANWFGDLGHRRSQGEVMEAKRKILSYNHPRPRQTLATQAQVDSFEAFLAWRRLLSSGILNSPTWAGVLHGMAVKNAEREERAAQHASLMKWQAWIHDGQADGLRRQHRFSRTPDGWIPTAKATGLWEGIDQSDEIEGLAGLSKEQLNAIKFEHAEKGVPADSQPQVD